MKDSKILVVGGSGFIGGETAIELINRGYEVTIVDVNYPDFDFGDAKFINSRLEDFSSYADELLSANVVYHFASVADIKFSRENPRLTIEQNVLHLTEFLERLRHSKVSRFLYASTQYVHGDLGSFYGASKRCAEIIIRAYAAEFNIDYTLLRYGSLYGPRAQSWNGLYKYVHEIVTTGKISYEGSGGETREYIHVRDAARLSVDILEKEYRNRALTLTGQQLIKSSELLNLIFEIMNKPANIKFDSKHCNQSHYATTPHRYTLEPAIKIVPEYFTDFSQGIMELITEIRGRVDDEGGNI